MPAIWAAPNSEAGKLAVEKYYPLAMGSGSAHLLTPEFLHRVDEAMMGSNIKTKWDVMTTVVLFGLLPPAAVTGGCKLLAWLLQQAQSSTSPSPEFQQIARYIGNHPEYILILSALWTASFCINDMRREKTRNTDIIRKLWTEQILKSRS